MGNVQLQYNPSRTIASSNCSWVTLSLYQRCSVLYCCFTSTETVRTIRNGEPRTATLTFTELLSSDVSTVSVRVQCCLTSTETVRTIRDGEPRTATSTFTRLLSCQHGVRVQCCFSPQRPYRLLGTGSLGHPSRL